MMHLMNMRKTLPAAAAALLVLSSALPARAHYEGELLPDSVAVMEYQMIISMAPKDCLTRNKLGMVYVRQNKLDKARQTFEGILAIEPGNFDALDSMGMVADKEGKYKSAAEWYKKALKARPDNTGVKQRLAAAQSKAGR